MPSSNTPIPETRTSKVRLVGSGGSIIWEQSKNNLDSHGVGCSGKIKSSSSSSKLQAAFLQVLGLEQIAESPADREGVSTPQPYTVRAYAPGEKIFCHRIGGGAGPRLSLVTEGVASVKVQTKEDREGEMGKIEEVKMQREI